MTKLSAAFVAFIILIVGTTLIAASGNAAVIGHKESDDQKARTAEDAEPFEWSIPGLVHDEYGKPVAGATIETLPGSQKQMRTTSGDDGQFVLEMRLTRPQGSPFIVSSPDGTLQSLIKHIDYNSPQKLTRVILKPVKKVTVSVQNKDGFVRGGATVKAIAEFCVVATGSTDEKGQATLKIPADAEVEWIYGYQDNHGFDYYENYAAFPSRERLSLPDNVTLTLDGNQRAKVRIVDSDEKPVAGVVVVPWTIMIKGKLSYINLAGVDFPMTDEAGLAEFPWMPASLEGRVSFLIRHPRYHCPKLPIFESEGVEPTAHVLRVVAIRGKVTFADGSPAAGVHLQGEGRGDTNMYFRDHTVTRQDGTYEFSAFPDQSTIIAVTDKFYAAKSHMDIRLKEGQSREDVDFVVNDGTLIRGKITLGKDQHPAVGEYTRLIQSSAGTDLVQFCITDTKGFYRFRTGPGTYELLLPNQDAAPPIQLTVNDEEEIVIDGHADRKDRVNLTGIVTDQSGTPLANCTVYGESIEVPGHAGFRTTTNVEGKFNSERWSDEMMVYAIQSEKLLAGTAEITEDSDEVTLKLRAATSATGIVRTKNGKPVVNTRVILNVVQRRTETAASLNLWTTTDENGGYSIRGILPGSSCRVDVYRADQHTAGPMFEVNSCEPIKLLDVVVSDNVSAE